MAPRLKTNCSIFEERGDPWVSQREGLRDFGRILETENPDLDCFTRAHKRKERHEKGPDKPIKPGSKIADDRRRIMNARIAMNRKLVALSKRGFK